MIGKVVEIFSYEGESLFGKVTGVQIKNGWPELIVDGRLFSFAEIVSIMEEDERWKLDFKYQTQTL